VGRHKIIDRQRACIAHPPPGMPTDRGVPLTTAGLSTWSRGSAALTGRGATCQRASESGTRASVAFGAGLKRASGRIVDEFRDTDFGYQCAPTGMPQDKKAAPTLGALLQNCTWPARVLPGGGYPLQQDGDPPSGDGAGNRYPGTRYHSPTALVVCATWLEAATDWILGRNARGSENTHTPD